MKPDTVFFTVKIWQPLLLLNFSYYLFFYSISYTREPKVKLWLWKTALMPEITLIMKIQCEVPICQAVILHWCCIPDYSHMWCVWVTDLLLKALKFRVYSLSALAAQTATTDYDLDGHIHNIIMRTLLGNTILRFHNNFQVKYTY